MIPASFKRLAACAVSLLVLASPAYAQITDDPGTAAQSIVTLETPPAAGPDPVSEEAVEPDTAPALPHADPYLWSAARSADGAVTLAGHVPAAAMQRFLLVRAGEGAIDATTLAAGAPENFVADALVALDLLLRLDHGESAFDGAAWTVSGEAPSAAIQEAIEAEIPDAWTAAIAAPDPAREPEPVEPEPAPEPEPIAPEPEPVPAPESPSAALEPPEPPVVDPAYAFSAVKSASGETRLAGQAPAEPMLRYFATIARADSGAVSVASGAPPDFLASAEAGLRALTLLEEGNLSLDSGAWSLVGRAASGSAADSALAALPDAGWRVEIAWPDPEDALCAERVAAFSARNAILFQSGSAAITPDSREAVAELAGHAALCPEAPLYIEGHTDSDGDARANLALSVMRAEAVVAALVELGIAPARLYAIGYGESDPIASNDTAEGKRLNRRIVVGLSPREDGGSAALE